MNLMKQEAHVYICVCVYVLYNICIDKPAHLNRLLFVKLKQNINKYGNAVYFCVLKT